MKKQTRWLLLLGTLAMAFPLFISPLVQVPDSIGDFIKGLGVAFIFSSLFVERKIRRTD